MSSDNNACCRSSPVMTVGALSQRSGVAVSAIHFYEREGLITATRNAANHRRYDRSTLRLLAIIKAGQRAGVPLAEIREALAPALSGQHLCRDDWRAISAAWRDDLDRRIEVLTKMRDRLDSCIQCGCLSHEQCPVFNEGDKCADLGPGARRLEPAG